MRPSRIGQFSLLLYVALACGACGAEVERQPVVGERLDCSIVAVQSDYLSTSVSLLNGDGSLCADHVLHSGSQAPGLAAALSGDVIAASGKHPDGLITLVDRFPSGTLTWLNPDTLKVAGQLSVATGFAANPQDVVYLSRTKAYVSRAATNPTPTSELSDFDEGGDLLVINPETRSIEGRIDLHGVVEAAGNDGLRPYPVAMAVSGGLVWVALGHQSADFGRGGEGMVVAIDPANDSIFYAVAVPGYKNCTTIHITEDGTRLWGVCTGVFQEGADAQLAASGLFTVNLAMNVPVVDWSLPASSLGGRPFAANLALIDSDRVLCATLGDLSSDLPDRLYVVNRSGSTATPIGIERGAYELGAILWHAEHGHALVSDASLDRPSILVVDPWADIALLSEHEANPTAALPPRDLRFYK